MSAATEPGPRPPAPPAGSCPSCRAPGPLRPVLDQPSVPVHTSVLLRSQRAALAYPRAAVRLEACGSCGFLTNAAFDAPGHDYSASYEETQAFSARFRAYADELATTLVERHGLRGVEVLELGCGRGDFLRLLCERGGNRGTGVDPSFAAEHVAALEAAGIRARRAFFEAGQVEPGVRAVVCRHSLEHVHDVHAFLTDLHAGLERAPEAVAVFELPDTTRILREGAFWDVFYEHASYFTAGSLARAFRAAGFAVTALERTFDEQYLLVTATRDGGEGPELALEEPPAETLALAERFAADVRETVARWRGIVDEVARDGGRAVIWGAGSKGVAFLAALDRDDAVAAGVDVNPAKHGMFMPGSGQPIVAPEALVELQPALVIVMNRAYLEEIRASLTALGLDVRVDAL